LVIRECGAVVGLVFRLLPASRALKLNPSEALGHE